MEPHILSSADQQANYFKSFVQCLVNQFQPLQLFCFSKTSVLTETNGCFKDQENAHRCNYCLLMVTESNTRIDHEVQDFTNFHYQHGTISILCHGQESILEAIKANNRFFMTVYTHAQLLYSHDGMSNFDFTGKFIPSQSAKKAQKHFDHRMPLAEGFLRGAGECLTMQDFNISTFMLHQVVEQCCILLIRVHLSYRSEIHNLLRMLRLCGAFSERPIKTFLSGSTEDERLFNLLMKSYSGSRYGNGFSVAGHDAQCLYDRITFFVTLTKEMCLAKIEELAHEALLYQELKEGSEVKVG
ncbi:HEPN domain-containing protein [Pedobacter sp. L105]|uniref:HEPN domain-containing protein n=1 Tax=Pedobacter sp. L105 TaxID=1641871 RepID=UPI00131D0657|nr:HEPN domain-containing protein [Pedobacter sp. L105]